MWPWSTIRQLRQQLHRLEADHAHQLWSVQFYQVQTLKAWRELAAANKGIKRLKDKLKAKGCRP